MNQPNLTTEQAQICPPDGPRRPRFALMGEFSAGKSTLANLMIGTTNLPAQVVATQLPPVWIRYGDASTTKISLNGVKQKCSLQPGSNISLEETAFIEFQCEADILKVCDLIDLPGLSDPNISSEVWERIMPFADAVIWCSPATQAWRQSEAAVWENVPQHVKSHSILLLTRADMIFEAADRRKVQDRARRETAGLFKRIQMISLTQAAEAENDDRLWGPSGAEEFVTNFMTTLDEIKVDLGLAEGTGNTDKEPQANTAAEPDITRGENALDIRKSREPNRSPQLSGTPESAYTPKFS